MTQPSFIPEPPLAAYSFSGPQGNIEGRLVASPLAKKMASEKGIDLTTVKGSGPHGRIMSRDLDLAQPAGTVTFGRREVPTITPGTYEEIPLSPIRTISDFRMSAAKAKAKASI